MNLEKTIRIKIINKNINENIYKNNEEEKKTKYCKCCKCTLLTEKYFRINRKGEYNKTCNTCLERRRKSTNKNKCEHGKRRARCKDCGGGSICEHNRDRSRCKDCGGGSICEHKRRRSSCKPCGGSQICEHNRLRSNCKECNGSQICAHNKIRSTCRDCGGGSICAHDKQNRHCQICDPVGHLKGIVSRRVRHALTSKKSKKSLEYLGCTAKYFKKHIEKSFVEGMSWENYGDWEIDHIIPIKYENPTIEEVIERLHWTNTQALWRADNIAKGNRYIG
jgi:hypothetical protein